MIEDIITKESLIAINESLKNKVVAMGQHGTGNLLKIESKFYIVTCKHVALEFNKSTIFKKVILKGNLRIPFERLNYLGDTDEEIDIAIYEIIGDLNNVAYYELNDFEIISNFLTHEWGNTLFIFSGLPATLVETVPKGYLLPPMRYLTMLSKSKPQEKDFLYLEYNEGNVQENELNGENVVVPKPHGISGSFILTFPERYIKVDEIWEPSYLKIVALEHRYLKSGNYLKCSNIIHLFELMKKLKIID